MVGWTYSQLQKADSLWERGERGRDPHYQAFPKKNFEAWRGEREICVATAGALKLPKRIEHNI